MRALKKEVHRQMQIHGDYKVGEEVIKIGIAIDLSIFRAGTTERTLPGTLGSRGRVTGSTLNRGWVGLRMCEQILYQFPLVLGQPLCWAWPHSQVGSCWLIVFIVWRNHVINTKPPIRDYVLELCAVSSAAVCHKKMVNVVQFFFFL